MIDPAGIQGSGQRSGDMLLADDFGEGRRAILAVQGHGEQGYRRPQTVTCARHEPSGRRRSYCLLVSAHAYQ
ncbi:Uncharacterised protein [Mycobacteroides abscessus subsp. abscessus]|nr:Uncharacterised protein [Mycobacteroides abscessus subsp. abscessus]